MHILEISSFFPPFGGAFCLEQSKALKARGHDVRILACNELGITVSITRYITARWTRWEEKIEGVTVYRSNYRAMPRNVKYNQHHWCKTVVSMYHDYVRRYGKPDVIHAHCCQWAGVAAWMISKESGIPFFITEHLSSMIFKANYGAEWTRNVWARELLTQTYQAANCVIPVSKELVDDLAPFFGRDYRWQEVSNIIDTDFFHFRQRQALDGRKFRFCCLAVSHGYNFHLKGYDVLAEAFRDIEGAELHIAGRATDSDRMRSAFGSNPSVIIHGNLGKDGVRDLLYHCDALVLASRSEVQPLVLLEAMATGIPVVSTEVTPQSERISNACFIAKIGHANSLREQMIKCMSIAPSQAFSDAVTKIASPEKIARKIEKVFLS